MIAKIEDAWNWYQATKSMSKVLGRLGEKHWDSLDWQGSLGRDASLAEVLSDRIIADTNAILVDLDDLCVLMLFSVFEATVRERVLRDFEEESKNATHVAVRRALRSIRDSIENGSFFQVLDLIKGADADLTEQVNQVRRYRNWVAHGRRGDKPDSVDPLVAFERLSRFLEFVDRLRHGGLAGAR